MVKKRTSRQKIKTKVSRTLTKIKHHPKNIFSATSGLKGYKVRGKKFAPTKAGKMKASKYASKVFAKYGKANIEYKY